VVGVAGVEGGADGGVGGVAGCVGLAGLFGRGNGWGVCAQAVDTHKLNTTKPASLITKLL